MTFDNNRLAQAVLWDLDGTLIDTGPAHWRAWQDEMKARGVDLSYEQFAQSFGRRNDTVLRLWVRPDISEAEIIEISESKEARYRAVIGEDGLGLLPGVEILLKRLRAEGWRQALATMTGRENVKAIFALLQVGPYFDAVVTAEEVQHGKPDPGVFLKAAERLGVPPERCVVIEDASAGVEAARRAGMRVVGVNAKIKLAADITVQSLGELQWEDLKNLGN